jgi:hypothetical protein
MKIGFICPNIPGHLNPMTALARHLQARNHEVVFLYSPSANGLPCVPGQKDDDMNANRPEQVGRRRRSSILLRCGSERNRGDFQIFAKDGGHDRG